MAERFRSPRYRDDAVAAYRMLVAEYPSSSLGDEALWSAVEVAREAGDRRRLAEVRPGLPRHLPRGRARVAGQAAAPRAGAARPRCPRRRPGPRPRLRPALLERRVLDPRRHRRRAQGRAPVGRGAEPRPALGRPRRHAAPPEPRAARLPGRRRPARAGPHRPEPRRRRARGARLQGRLGAPGLLPRRTRPASSSTSGARAGPGLRRRAQAPATGESALVPPRPPSAAAVPVTAPDPPRERHGPAGERRGVRPSAASRQPIAIARRRPPPQLRRPPPAAAPAAASPPSLARRHCRRPRPSLRPRTAPAPTASPASSASAPGGS